MRTGGLVILAMCLFAAAVRADEELKWGEGRARQIAEEMVAALRNVWEQHHQPGANKRSLLTWSPGQGVGTFQQFLANFYGQNWTSIVPPSWQLPSFSWSSLGEFDYTSNLQDFVDAVHAGNITKPTDLKGVHDTMAQVASFFCTPEKFVPSQKVFATCVGPKVSLAYVPKVCVLDKASQEVVCDPAKIVLRKTAGGCTHKYMTPASWKGKECKITGGAGFTKAVQHGGSSYVIPLATISASYQP